MFWDIVGYSAAFFSNISLYPLAWNAFIFSKNNELIRLDSISMLTLIYNEMGCSLWFIYAFNTGLLPIMVGAVMSFIPTTFIIITKLCYFKNNRDTSAVTPI